MILETFVYVLTVYNISFNAEDIEYDVSDYFQSYFIYIIFINVSKVRFVNVLQFTKPKANELSISTGKVHFDSSNFYCENLIIFCPL